MHMHAAGIVAHLRALVRLIPIALMSHHIACRATLKPAGGCGFASESLKVCRSNFPTVVNAGHR